MDLESIPGVGKKTAEALAALDDPEGAIRTGDVAALTTAPGITNGRAVQIARGAIMREHDDSGTFLATDHANSIYRDILSLLKEHAVTRYAQHRLETFYPSNRRSRIEEVRELTQTALTHDINQDVLDALETVSPLETSHTVQVRDRCLATSDAERYSQAKSAFPELSVELVEDTRGLSDLARGYATVIALDEEFTGVELDGDVRVEPDALDTPVDIVPERYLMFFANNQATIRAAIRVHQAANLKPPCDIDALSDCLSNLHPDGSIANDDELDRLRDAVDDIDVALSTAESVANDRLREAIQEQNVTIEGADLLSLVERGAGVDSLFSRELADEYDAAVEAARNHLIDSLSLDATEAEIATRAFPDEPTFPVEHTSEVRNRLHDTLETAAERHETQLKRSLASSLGDHRSAVETLVSDALELDVELSIARFAEKYQCSMPSFTWENENDDPAIEIVGGRSPLLQEPVDAIEPVDYSVTGVTILSGVNSGGKTSTLDLVASVVILAHMGMPVPAERVTLRRFNGLYYQAKTQGTLDAGAFEATVRQFAEITTESDNSLVLVDELESITEPGASAKIIAGILEAFEETASTGIFVSHLANEIREVATFDVPVDGIEAVGLVDGELQVNRSPVKNHLARSTPELIVEKLATETDAPFYDRLLDKFD